MNPEKFFPEGLLDLQAKITHLLSLVRKLMDTPLRPREIFTVVPRILHWRDEGIMPILEKKFAERCTTMVQERKAPFNIDSKTIVMSLIFGSFSCHGIYPVHCTPHIFPTTKSSNDSRCSTQSSFSKAGPPILDSRKLGKKQQPGKQLERTKSFFRHPSLTECMTNIDELNDFEWIFTGSTSYANLTNKSSFIYSSQPINPQLLTANDRWQRRHLFLLLQWLTWLVPWSKLMMLMLPQMKVCVFISQRHINI